MVEKETWGKAKTKKGERKKKARLCLYRPASNGPHESHFLVVHFPLCLMNWELKWRWWWNRCSLVWSLVLSEPWEGIDGHGNQRRREKIFKFMWVSTVSDMAPRYMLCLCATVSSCCFLLLLLFFPFSVWFCSQNFTLGS